ncbi:hypothetical protein [Anabaena sp. UHCC 0399]|uniref:hypothetical protein n=1 Tax=Anabaena sp. UHCC 0399 TaxID=3110238 RepID=UPI002B20E126|nr:hypothetical protein [Anabaena sp. UHCC 0399]MEA5566673.1 hypothetical protein [Anabaena sp. UHCC 0399]
MTLEFKHFDTRLNQWIHTDGDQKNPNSILTEKLDNTLLEFYFPGREFSFGHIDEYSKAEDLKNHPDGNILLLSSKTRLLYGSPECLLEIDKLCPDRKDRGAYGSIFLGACKDSIHEELNILVVDDSTGENGGLLKNKDAFKLVGDCYGQIAKDVYDKLTKREEQPDRNYRVIQHRFGWAETDGEDKQYRFGKGTLRPHDLEKLTWRKGTPKIDLILPLSSFKGTDKDRPGGASKPQIKPGLYQQKIWLGEKYQSEKGLTAISQLLASFPQGIKDFAEELEAQAQKLADNQDDPRKVAQLYCEKYEKRKAFTESQKTSLEQQITLEVFDVSLVKQLELLTWNETDEEFEINDGYEQSQKDDLLMYKLIKADLISGHNQLLETEKVRKELSRFVQNEWRDIAIGRTLTFDRGMIIPSKELKNGEICVPWMNDGEKVLNFRSPFLNSNGLCVSTNKLVEDRLAPDGKNLEGIIVVNDEDHKRILARLETEEIAPLETESERQGRDFDGDCIGVAPASKYPNFTAEAEYRNQPENAYAPTVKLKKQSFYLPDGTQPPFEEIAIHMSDSISVGVINNQVTALEALESEIEILKTYGTLEQKSEYLDQVANHYQGLFEAENYQKAKPIRAEYRPYMQAFIALAQEARTPEIIQQAMDVNRKMYRQMIEEGCYQNQIAVDLFKSAKKPEMDLIRENQRYLYRDVNYIKDKKSRTAYLNSGITTSGYSPVELLINQTNKYFQESQLESRPIIQFQDLFKGVEFTPQQKFAAIAAKYEFDQLFNAAVTMERRREIERGPSAVIQTSQGAQIEITNLTRYGHPGIWQAQSINLKLEAIPEKYQTKERPHTLMAVAQINGELEEGKSAYRKLGTVSVESVEQYNLKPGMSANNTTLVDLKPELSQGQTKLMFGQAYQLAEAFRESIPEQERLSAAAAAWSVGAARQDELENKESPAKAQKKIPNFVFAAFGDEIVSRLEQLQFTELRLGTLGNEANNFKEKVWNKEEKYPIEIRASHHPPEHDRYGSRLVFVQDSDGDYKEYAALSRERGQLPIGTKAQVNFIPAEAATANATISLPGREPVEFNIRELSKFSYAGQSFHAEPVTLEIGKKKVKSTVVKMKLDGKTVGELEANSIKQLEAFNSLKDGKQLTLKLKTISGSEHGFVIATSPNDNLLRINKIHFYDYKGETFNDKDYRKLTLEVPPSKTRDAVFLNGEPLGVLHENKYKEALRELGVLKEGKMTAVEATLQSNFTITVMKVDPQTVEYPEVWTKESQPNSQWAAPRYANAVRNSQLKTIANCELRIANCFSQVFGQQLNKLQQQQQQQFADAAPILYKIKERPTILYATPEDKLLGLIQLVVDNHKVETVTKWLTEKNIAISPVPAEDVPLETKKGLAVFNVVNSSIPESVCQAMTFKFGQVIESQLEYQEKVRSLPDRPKYLKPPQPLKKNQTSNEQTLVVTQHIQKDVAMAEVATGYKLEEKQQAHSARFSSPAFVVTVDHLREWYSAADKLGKPEAYKQRIVEVANRYKSGRQLSPEALTAMEKDTEEYQSISRLTKIAQRIGDVLGQPGEDGFTCVRGKIYDLAFNPQTKDLAITYSGAQLIAQKDGEVILSVQLGKVQTNKVTPEILQVFEDANTQIDKNQAQFRERNREFHR